MVLSLHRPLVLQEQTPVRVVVSQEGADSSEQVEGRRRISLFGGSAEAEALYATGHTSASPHGQPLPEPSLTWPPPNAIPHSWDFYAALPFLGPAQESAGVLRRALVDDPPSPRALRTR